MKRIHLPLAHVDSVIWLMVLVILLCIVSDAHACAWILLVPPLTSAGQVDTQANALDFDPLSIHRNQEECSAAAEALPTELSARGAFCLSEATIMGIYLDKLYIWKNAHARRPGGVWEKLFAPQLRLPR